RNSTDADEEIVDVINCLDANSWEAAHQTVFTHFCSRLGRIPLRGTWLIIPKSLWERVLELAHEGHPVESAMKRRLRVKVWWL
ncbi:hypothetical protein KR038_003224, partial [Drosophila bunnanda]